MQHNAGSALLVSIKHKIFPIIIGKVHLYNLARLVSVFFIHNFFIFCFFDSSNLVYGYKSSEKLKRA